MQYRVDGRIVEMDAATITNVRDVFEAWAAIESDPDVASGSGLLCDSRAASFDAGGDAIQHIAQAARTVIPKIIALAVVVQRPEQKGMANQFKVYAEISGGPAVKVLGDVQTARDWLRTRLGS